MKPSENIPASELWLAATTMPRPHRIVDFPRKRDDGQPIGQLAIRALNQAEHLQAGIAAEKLVRKELPDANKETSLGYETAYSNAVAVEQLWRAARDANDLERPCFPSPKAMREHLTTDEIGVLFSQFLDVCSEIGPIVSLLSKEECDAWIDQLIAGGEVADPLPFFSSEALRLLLRRSVERLQISPTRPFLPGSPPDDPGLEMPSDEDSLS